MKVRILATPPDPATGEKQPAGIRIEDLPKGSTRQRIPVQALEQHQQTGHVTIEADRFVYHTVDGDVVFHIRQEPGRYCLTCGERLPDFGGNGRALEARRAQQCIDHVAAHGDKAVKSPDWPHGYENRPSTFTCEVEDLRGK